jgi:predicted MarR family transcription regulator
MAYSGASERKTSRAIVMNNDRNMGEDDRDVQSTGQIVSATAQSHFALSGFEASTSFCGGNVEAFSRIGSNLTFGR